MNKSSHLMFIADKTRCSARRFHEFTQSVRRYKTILSNPKHHSLTSDPENRNNSTKNDINRQATGRVKVRQTWGIFLRFS